MTDGKQPPDVGAPDPHDGMLGYESVRTWIESVQAASLRPGADRARRLSLIEAFSSHIGVDPDTIVRTARGDQRAKNAYLRQLVSWAAELPGSDRARHDAENTIRSFFMRNGFRVVARPYRDVYERSAP